MNPLFPEVIDDAPRFSTHPTGEENPAGRPSYAPPGTSWCRRCLGRQPVRAGTGLGSTSLAGEPSSIPALDPAVRNDDARFGPLVRIGVLARSQRPGRDLLERCWETDHSAWDKPRAVTSVVASDQLRGPRANIPNERFAMIRETLAPNYPPSASRPGGSSNLMSPSAFFWGTGSVGPESDSAGYS